MQQGLRNLTKGELKPVFTASETFANVSVPAAVGIGTADIDVLDTFIAPGPMHERVVLAVATMTNLSYMLVREYVQPFNFSLDADGSMCFIVPPWAPGITDDDGYATITISSQNGPHTELRLAFFYTEDCPRAGWFGRGLDCRPCIKGGYPHTSMLASFQSSI